MPLARLFAATLILTALAACQSTPEPPAQTHDCVVIPNGLVECTAIDAGAGEVPEME